MSQSRETNERGLTPLQQEFCHRYVWHFSDPAGTRSATQAAKDAGYAESGAQSMASNLMKKHEVRKEIVRLSEELFHEAVPLAVATLIELMSTGTNAVRKAAAERCVDQAGLGVVTRTEATVTVKDQRTPEQMLARLQELAEKHPELQRLIPAQAGLEHSDMPIGSKIVVANESTKFEGEVIDAIVIEEVDEEIGY